MTHPRQSDPTWKIACRCAFSNGVPRRSLGVALIVGALLNMINQGDAFVSGRPLDWLKIALTFLVPYGVSTYGAVSYELNLAASATKGNLSSGASESLSIKISSSEEPDH
jgi:hypothetical protein